MLMRVAVCAAMTACRLAELAWSRRNVALQGPSNEGELARRTYPAIVALHTATIAATLLFGASRPRWPWLLLLLSVQPLRWWTLGTLGKRWNARGAVPEKFEAVTDGPYALVRHPNYAIVLAELAALPAAFGLCRVSLLATVVNAGLLAIRIRDEESLLFQHEDYRDHFSDKPRLLPRLF